MSKIGDLLAQITGDSVPASSSANSVQKRKANDDLPRTNDKQVKREQNPANISRPISQIQRPADFQTALPKSNSRLNASVPPFVPKAGRSPATTPTGSGSTTPTTTGPSKQPKKGSFAEIMARGKVAQATFAQVGKIQHKPIEKGLNKRERQEMKDQKLQKSGSRGKPRPSGEKSARDGQRRPGDNGKGPVQKSQPSIPEKKIKKAATATTGYTGTARQIAGSSRSAKSMSAHRPSGRDVSSSRRYEFASDEEDEDDIDEEEEYYSDASSDMEAGAFEVDEEEARAARIARKEDEAALAEENHHKREKEEKRRMLAAMAKARNKR